MLCKPAPPGTPDFLCGETRLFMACCVSQIICFLIIQLWLSSLVSSNQNENEPVCFPNIKVPRNTVWKVRVTNSLKINCTIFTEPHCWKNVTLSWCIIDDKNRCRPLNHSHRITTAWRNRNEIEGMSFLLFQNVSMQDAGLYRCRIKSPTPTFGHSINVTVTDYIPDDVSTDYKIVSQENHTTNSLNPSTGNKDYLLSYIYICSGIGVLLLIVAVVSVIIFWCRGKKKSSHKKINENQSAATPVAELAPPICKRREFPHSKTQTLPAQLSPPPPCVYDTPPVRGMSLRDRLSAGRQPVDLMEPHGPQRRCRDRGTVEEVEEENPLIYATLNHNVPQRPVRVDHVQIEASEYAAIKVT